MSKKKWHESIPAGGVLCKENSSGSIIRIMGKVKSSDFFMLFDDCTSKHYFGMDELTPLTAAEWCDFAPWQDMKGAQKDTLFLALLKNGNVIPAYISSVHGDIGIRLVNGEIDEIYPANYFKGWLPLPQVSK